MQGRFSFYNGRMGRPYGRTRKPTSKAPKNAAKGKKEPFKIKLRGRDGKPLSMSDLRDSVFEALHRLKPFADSHRAKWATLYLTVVDENGKEVHLDPSG